MVRYICENNHRFLHTAKLIQALTEYISVETPVCPICRSMNIDECVVTERIVSVISVDLADVDSRLKEGYEVESLYAKTATLVRRE